MSEYCECEKPLTDCVGGYCHECRKDCKPLSTEQLQEMLDSLQKVTMTQAEIRAKKVEYIDKIAGLNRQIDHVRVDFQHLYLECEHPDKYSHNAMGRDPHGARCPDCGKCW